MASSPVLSTGPAARTLVLLTPQLAATALVPPSATGGVPLPSSSSSSSGAAGFMMGNSMPMPKILDPHCFEGLLGYARLLFGQPHGGKLCVLGGAGNKMHTITSWDPGQQTLEAIVKGFSQWKFPEQQFTALDLQFAIQESVHCLFQPPVDEMEDDKSKIKGNLIADLQETIAVPAKAVSESWKAAQMARARLFVIMAPGWAAGDAVDIYHKMVLGGLMESDTRSSRVECLDVLFMDVSGSDMNSNTCICMQDSVTGIILSTAFYKLPPALAPDLFLDLSYLHVELSAIAVKGLGTPLSKHQVDESNGGVSTLIKQESNEGPLELNLSSSTDMRLVLYQSPILAMTGGPCFTPNGGELRKSRTIFLHRVKRRISKPQLLSLPYASVSLALLEVPHSRSAAQFWETVRLEEADTEGHVVIALSSERNSMSATHVLVWFLERFWLRVLKLRDMPDAMKAEDLVDDKSATRNQGGHLFSPSGLVASMTGKMSDDDMVDLSGGQGAPLFAPDGLVASMSGKVSDDKLFANKKRSCEEMEESGNSCCASNLAVREKKGSKQLERPNRCCPLTNSETLIGGPDRHSASLAALLAPIR